MMHLTLKLMKQVKTVFTLLLCLLAIGAVNNTSLKAQPTPILQCVNVQLSGNILLTWTPGTVGVNCGATFTAYNIYVANNIATFTLLTSVSDPLQTTFTDAV